MASTGRPIKEIEIRPKELEPERGVPEREPEGRPEKTPEREPERVPA